MAEISQKDQLALHEFSVRYRAGLAQKQADWEKSLSTVQGVVREEYEREQEAARSEPTTQPPSAGAEHQVEDPDEGR